MPTAFGKRYTKSLLNYKNWCSFRTTRDWWIEFITLRVSLNVTENNEGRNGFVIVSILFYSDYIFFWCNFQWNRDYVMILDYVGLESSFDTMTLFIFKPSHLPLAFVRHFSSAVFPWWVFVFKACQSGEFVIYECLIFHHFEKGKYMTHKK